MTEAYELRDGIYVPPGGVAHRDEEYDPRGFEMLRQMQRRHFWYRGRHRFLLHAVRRQLARLRRQGGPSARPPRAIDLGGGCGGWVDYLTRQRPFPTAELALADSSPDALEAAAEELPADVDRYQVDLLDLRWQDRWEMAFLLDVLEHISQQEQALREVHRALAPGGLLFITTPALQCFWTWNDELAHHVRRYAKSDFRRLAGECGFRLLEARYFMFFLSPLLLASRLAAGTKARTEEQARALMEKMHRVPNPAVNAALGLVFSLESPLGHVVPFPWGTSILAVLEKPAGA
jgi:SAM-dependent methyltransferase